MAVVKKKKYQPKSVRQQQQILQTRSQLARHDFEASRLRAEQVGAVVHDESDTISFRSYILKNFINGSAYMNALTVNPVPLHRLKEVSVYGSNKDVKLSIISLEKKLEQEILLLDQLRGELDKEIELPDFERTLLGQIGHVDINSIESIDNALVLYRRKFAVRMQDTLLVRHDGKFEHLKSDKKEAPEDYWQNYHEFKRKEKERRELEKKLALEQKLREEQEQKRLFEEAEAKRKLEEQQRDRIKLQQLQQQNSEENRIKIMQQQQQDFIRQQKQEENNPAPLPRPLPSQIALTGFDAGQNIPQLMGPENNPVTATVSNNPNILGGADQPSVPLGTQDVDQNGNEQQDLLDDMFGEYNNEPFNNGFDDDFGDLDNVFF
ncbi:Snf6p KNAG_0J02830 [Huiozyma naganishii CBS 8797]|uniref:Uncharacterized protein n=1 Tax=Huiozyma naganishii (strain ATCC MYA-139 / BCRC 22969 / CBS 8797 / KCTC 17520 / NBRC 10181 / NCYC 3082 / Yp74L-3) TaxID=1071383 RepID=J7S316_HUIN7|nr:hypothetical protein KNAG_0J02830 [Kazachstania naganishii CBS 8797]CCK72362.1 hypothetical protein KNAG_0J02830 [Kazachstania naganishii CBS 8797]